MTKKANVSFEKRAAMVTLNMEQYISHAITKKLKLGVLGRRYCGRLRKTGSEG